MHSEKSLKRRRRRLFHILRAALAFLLVVILAVLAQVIPAKSLVSAREIPARSVGETRIHFLSVGQGDCSVVEFSDGRLLVIDAGDGSFENRTALIQYIKGLSYTELTLFVSHADIDHFGGAETLIRTFGAKTLYLPAEGQNSREWDSLKATAESAGCEILNYARYDVIARTSDSYCVCVSPRRLEETNGNESSGILYLNCSGIGVLFCGDMTSARESLLMRESALSEGIFDSGDLAVRLQDTDILKVAHHGSAGGSSAAWLEFLSPKEAVISCGRGNVYAHPAAEAVARLTEAGVNIWRTDELGDIVVPISGGEYSVNTHFTE